MRDNFWEQGNLTRVNFRQHLNLFLGNKGETPIFSREQGDMHPPGRPSYVRLKVKEKVSSSHGKINLHITLDGVNAVINWFWGHPFHRKFLCILSTVHILVNFSHQTKVCHFGSVITANQNITSCKVTMNEAFLCEMILKQIWKN